jgi:hypothetical protein
MKYAKALLAVLATVVSAVVAALAGGGTMTPVAWVNVLLAGLGACAVFAGPNVPGAKYTKAILAVLMTVGTALVPLLSAGHSFTTADLLQLLVVALGALGVLAVPNKAPAVPATAGK